MTLDRDRLLAIFGEELEDRRRDLEHGLLGLEDDPDAERRTELIAELFRAAHSLKGAAHSAGISSIAKVAHRLEELFAQLRSSGQVPDPEHIRAALAAVDELDELGQQLQEDASSGPAPEAAERRRHQRTPEAVGRSGSGAEQLRARVASEDLDTALTAAGDLHLEISAITELSGSLGRLARQARRLQRDWQEVRASPRDDAAATTTVIDRFDRTLQEVTASTLDTARRASERERQLRMAAGEVRHAVQRLGLVAFDEVCAGLDRVARDVAASAAKRVRLAIETETLELDRGVAAVLRDPLVHLVRNAVDHGLEEPNLRMRAGKAPEGRVTVTAELHAGEVVVAVSDDGAGLDASSIRRAAVERGLDVPAADEDLPQLLFAPGFSTRSTATDVSGRGVGLDAARTSIEAVGGSIEIQAAADQGMTVRMRLPLTLSTMRAVVVRVAGDDVIALPAATVNRVRRLQSKEVTTTGGRRTAVINGRPVPLADLGQVLGCAPANNRDGSQLVVVVHTADGEAAMVVDEIIDEREIWVRPLPARLQALRGVLGGAVLAGGRSVLLLSPATWVRSMRRRDAATAPSPAAPAIPDRARILLAEDTATTRMLEQSILESGGYEVVVAADGREAWQLLQEVGADLVVTDVDMPRMDGFELCSTIRSSPQFDRLPVVLVTSLADDSDRARGLAVGADAYFVKSGFDQTSLLDTIARLL